MHTCDDRVHACVRCHGGACAPPLCCGPTELNSASVVSIRTSAQTQAAALSRPSQLRGRRSHHCCGRHACRCQCTLLGSRARLSSMPGTGQRDRDLQGTSLIPREKRLSFPSLGSPACEPCTVT